MSGPFRFEHDTVRSPLDRTPTAPAGQSLNFKTNVNRMKTKKWVQAKPTDYGGDDWGDYDEYDEYGVNQEPHPDPPPTQPSAQPSSRRYYGQLGEQQSRNFTDPSQQTSALNARRHSFEHGEEQRAFSSSSTQPRQDHTRQHDALPALQTSTSPPQTGSVSSPSNNSQFSPNKGSVGRVDVPTGSSPHPRTGSDPEKLLPFIRPADIYRRVEEERERERASSNPTRPSLDSGLSSSPPPPPPSGAGSSVQPLDKSVEPRDKLAQAQSSPLAHQAVQPEVASVFDDGFWSSGPDLHGPVHRPPGASWGKEERDLRSVVDQAFTRKDEQRSIPPTPVSRGTDFDMSRSDTNSTSSSSPIMSRAPSAAAPTPRIRNPAGADGSTPTIAEDPRESELSALGSTTMAAPASGHQVFAKPLPAHPHNMSSTSLPVGGAAIPTQRDSPARSPSVTPQKNLPEPKATQLDEDAQIMKMESSGPFFAHATREADDASFVKNNPVSAVPLLEPAEKSLQDGFSETHTVKPTVEAFIPRDRSESPSKSRVQALAGKFDNVSHSRRGSTQSRHSLQSWERSHETSRAASPTKTSPNKSDSPVKEFRPRLPGQWESYATSVATPMEESEGTRELRDNENTLFSHPPSNNIDPASTATEQSHPTTKPPDDSDPMAVLRNAAAAMVESFKSTTGTNEDNSDSDRGQRRFKQDGEVNIPRPLQLDRTISSVSSIPPTPPVKDTPKSEHPPPLLGEDSDRHPNPQLSQSSSLPSASGNGSSQDEHRSDRLHNDIMASLSPVTVSIPTDGSKRASLQPASPGTNRASSILPREYDSYWEDSGGVPTRPSQDVERDISDPLPAGSAPVTTQAKAPPPPALLHRFSWEPSGRTSQAPSATATATKDSHMDKSPLPTAGPAPEEGQGKESNNAVEVQPALDHTSPSEKAAPAPGAVHVASSDPPGLHVVNTKDDPEAVELPARYSMLNSEAQRMSQEEGALVSQSNEIEQSSALSASPAQAANQSAVQDDATAKSTSTDKPLSTRQIASITSVTERIAHYNKSRDHWATCDHGLDKWLTLTLDANPELVTQPSNAQPSYNSAIRHKKNASLSIRGKFNGGGEAGTPADMQTSTNATSPTATAPSSSGLGGRISGQQMKGKELLHTAGVLGGKGVTSAKGLFAKGRSRFGRDKVDK